MSFQPTQISGCKLWLDGADNSTLTFNGVNVSNWADKSGNGNNAQVTNPPAGTNGPTRSTYNSYPVLNFSGTAQTLRSPGCTITYDNHCLIAVHRPNTVTANNFGNTSLFRFQDVASAQYVVFPYMGGTTPRGYITNATGGTNMRSSTSAMLENSVTTSLNLIMANIGPTSQIVYKNGNQQATNSQSISGTITYSLQIGCYFPAVSNFYQGDLAEMIIFDRALTTSERQQVEGYLAWKWGLETALPAAHPYKNFPPTSLTIQSSTELNLVNTTVFSGTITLPPAADIPGRIMTFKDIYGSFRLSTTTLSTSGTDTFEDNTNLDILGDPFGSYTFAAGIDNKWYTIGGSYMNAANISSIFASNLNTNFISSGNVTTSTLQIKDSLTQSTSIVYNQSTLMFYSSAINNFIVGPTKAPKWTFLPTRGLFLPNQVTSLRLWYDAADVNTIQFSTGNNVSFWFDKSGYGYHGFQTTPANRPTYTPGALNFNGTNTQLIAIDPDIRPTNAFIVLTSLPDPPAGDSSRTYLQKGTTGSVGEFWMKERYNTATPQYHYQFFIHNGTTQNSAATAQVANGWILNERFIYAARFAFGTNLNIMLNGSNATTNVSGSPSGENNLTSNLFIGSSPLNTQYFKGQFNEILMYNERLSDPNRQQVEGYLAWKWNMVSSLPANHPYKFFPP